MSIRSFYTQSPSYGCNTDIFLDKVGSDESFAQSAYYATADSGDSITARGAALKSLTSGENELTQFEAEQLVHIFDAAVDASSLDQSHPNTPDLAS